MPDTPKKFYLTTPIYYVNARPHIGHAYSTIAADVLARRHRLLGDDTFFLTGTDEHGQKVQRSAEKAGIPPQQFADQVSATFRDLWARMGITNDAFIRTTDEHHKRGVQKLWSTLVQAGAIYLSSYTGQYSVGEEMFVDGPPGTLGPDGKPTETVTEENYFFRLSDYQERLINLIEDGPNGEPPQLHIQPEAVRNEVLSFLRGNIPSGKLSEAKDPHKEIAILSEAKDPHKEIVILSEARDPHKEIVILSEAKDPLEEIVILSEARDPHKEIVILSEARDPLEEIVILSEAKDLLLSSAGTPYLPGALKDLSISRTTFTWGILVPNDPKHVIYVWLDALANYITAIGYGSDSPADQATFAKYWPANLHLVGKEITRFHCVYWPAFLMAAGLPLPKSVVANGWLLFEDSKMSKSRGNVVRTETILDAFGPLCPPVPRPTAAPPSRPGIVILSEAKDLLSPGAPQAPAKAQQDLFAADVLRYYLLREIPFGQDGSFSFDALITRYNADLANGYGNLVSRTLTMIDKYCDARIPADLSGNVAFKSQFEGLIDDFARYFADYKFGAALTHTSGAIGTIDALINEIKPWKLATSDDPQALSQLRLCLYTAAESIRIITALLYPILPYATASVWRQLGLGDIEEAARKGELKDLQWGGLKPGTKLGPLAPIFPRADKGLAQIMANMESPSAVPVSQISDEPTTNASTPPADPTDPAAAPRTASLPIENPGATVAGSHALTTERPATPSSLVASQPATGNTQPATPPITIDDFVKIDLRVARIVVAERIPKADKLLRLEVDLGPLGRRQILSGIAEWYTPEELLGRRIAVIANLAPRTMRGLESHGMLLAASDDSDPTVHGRPTLATFSDEIPLGSRIR